MSATANSPAAGGLDLSRAEQWVLHHVMVDRVDRAYDEERAPPWWAVSVAAKLESVGDAGPSPGSGVEFDDCFTTFEAWRMRHALVDYAERADVPTADADLAWAIVDRLEHEFEAAPRVIR